MNKREREKLGQIAANLLYSFDSDPVMTGIGRELVKEFPCINEEVDSWRRIHALDNVSRSIGDILYIRKEHWPGKDCAAVLRSTYPQLFNLCVAYFNGIEDEERVFEIEDSISCLSVYQSWDILSEIILSDRWADAVCEVFEKGSDEYVYLTTSGIFN